MDSHEVRLTGEEEHEADDHEAVVSAGPEANSHDVLVDQSPPGKEDGWVENGERDDRDREFHLVLPQRRDQDDVLWSALVLDEWQPMAAYRHAESACEEHEHLEERHHGRVRPIHPCRQ